MDFDFRIDTPLGEFESPVKFDFYAKGKFRQNGEAHGLYILCKRLGWNRFEVLYVGETRNCRTRLEKHRVTGWTHVFHEYGMTAKSRRYWEAVLILGLKPPENRAVVAFKGWKGETAEMAAKKVLGEPELANLISAGHVTKSHWLVHPPGWNPILTIVGRRLVFNGGKP